MVRLQLKDPLELHVLDKRREFFPDSGFLYNRPITLAVESDVKTHSIHPSLHFGA